MTPLERRASGWLASIYGLRMLGLFLILPVFAIYAPLLRGGATTYQIGLAFGIYGATQAFLHVAFGTASDRFGRKPVIVFGLVLFALGAVIAALSETVTGIVIGRAIQGAGAVSSAVSAFVADSTRPEVRTKAMAMVGGTIGMVFSLSMVIAPPLTAWIGLSGLFWLTAALAVIGIIVVLFVIPSVPRAGNDSDEVVRHGEVMFDPQLLRLNIGAFVLHLCQTAIFVVVPPMLVAGGGLPSAQHWWVYLPIMVITFAAMVPPMLAAERRGKARQVFLVGIGLLLIAMLAAPVLTRGALAGLAGFLLLFFMAFNLLEAMQPSLVSKLAPPRLKGFAMGVYGTTQSAGLALGGFIGGSLARHFGDNAVFYVCAALAALWFVAAYSMTPPPVKSKES